MKRILIPTDFSIDSLNAVHAAVDAHKGNKISIVLLHLVDVDHDISSVLLRMMRRNYDLLITRDFEDTCQILQNRYRSSIQNIRIEFGFSGSKGWLNNFIEGARIDQIIACSDIQLRLPSRDSVAMMPLLRKAKIPLLMTEAAAAKKNADLTLLNMMPEKGLRVPNRSGYVVEK